LDEGGVALGGRPPAPHEARGRSLGREDDRPGQGLEEGRGRARGLDARLRGRRPHRRGGAGGLRRLLRGHRLGQSERGGEPMKRAAVVLSLLAVVAVLAAPARYPRARAVARAAEPERAQFGSYPTRNMVSEETGLPAKWDVKTGTNIKWSQATGSQTYAGPVVADGKVFLGTNNEAERNPKIKGDKGVVMAFKADTGDFLWQMVTDKLTTGRV